MWEKQIGTHISAELHTEKPQLGFERHPLSARLASDPARRPAAPQLHSHSF